MFSKYEIENLLCHTKYQVIPESQILQYYSPNTVNNSGIDYIVVSGDIIVCIQSRNITNINMQNNNINNITNNNTLANFVQCVEEISQNIHNQLQNQLQNPYSLPMKIVGIYLSINKINSEERILIDKLNERFNVQSHTVQNHSVQSHSVLSHSTQSHVSRIKYYNFYDTIYNHMYNNIYNNPYIHTNHNNSYFQNQKKNLLEKLQSFLHKLQIFTFDDEDDCYMDTPNNSTK
uniref:Uncharacterized protein n=1 Tax=viral metagenome TaxID=1070528 RepID=A0A6C0EZN2_9ZZZZ